MTTEKRKIVFSRHSLERMAERSIEKAWVEMALNEPDFERADLGATGERRAFRCLPEAGHRWLRVVYRFKGDDVFVVTAFLDRKAEKWR